MSTAPRSPTRSGRSSGTDTRCALCTAEPPTSAPPTPAPPTSAPPTPAPPTPAPPTPAPSTPPPRRVFPFAPSVARRTET
ncbi:hypothetical protein FLP10_10395 [Agromyces intestinalis]|uniref:Uncharacterized protein n=1 Tax=Agromyces intestinalis TaxID=2592652 RepID=A0A5C1YJ21_9MICO|nr:hypothetical protein FLP10_10395 [Agromyces intestinalis]